MGSNLAKFTCDFEKKRKQRFCIANAMARKQYVTYALLIEKVAWTMNTVGWTTSIAVAAM